MAVAAAGCAACGGGGDVRGGGWSSLLYAGSVDGVFFFWLREGGFADLRVSEERGRWGLAVVSAWRVGARDLGGGGGEGLWVWHCRIRGCVLSRLGV